MDALSRDILSFWFGTADPGAPIERRPIWFRATPAFDARITRDYTGAHEQAAAGALDRLMDTAADCLALILALDQFPRNIFRGTARAYASDAKARAVARHALDRGYDRGFDRWPRAFVYLPFEHSEALADQDRSVALFRALGSARSLDSALAHREAIHRFGRFPHRNAALGRENTPDEADYLKNPPPWGMTAAQRAALEEREAAGD